MTAHNHYNAGCPDLSLQVLLELPPPKKETAADVMVRRTYFMSLLEICSVLKINLHTFTSRCMESTKLCPLFVFLQ